MRSEPGEQQTCVWLALGLSLVFILLRLVYLKMMASCYRKWNCDDLLDKCWLLNVNIFYQVEFCFFFGGMLLLLKFMLKSLNS